MGDFVYGGDYLARVYGPGARDQRLESFGQGRWSDRGIPSVWLAVEAAEVSRPEVLADATDGELLGVGRAWKSLEGWAFCGKLEVVRELIRRYPAGNDGEAGPEAVEPPAGWDRRLHHEIGAALGISVAAAGKLAELAWALDNRLPGIRAALEEGRVDPGRARMIADETSVLDRADQCAKAEEVILAGIARCRTWSDLLRLVQRAVIMADPDGARKRRERAEREEARLRFWREASGTCGLQGTGLPADEALAARAHIEARAQAYKAAGIRRPVEMLRIMALADILNGIPAVQRVEQALAEDQARAAGAGEAAGADEQAARDARLRDAARQAKAKFRDKTRDNPSGETGDNADDQPEQNSRSNGTAPDGTARADGRAGADGRAPGPGGGDSDDPFDDDPGDGGPGDGPSDSGPSDSGPSDSGPGDSGPSGSGPGDSGTSDGGPGGGGSPGDPGDPLDGGDTDAVGDGPGADGNLLSGNRLADELAGCGVFPPGGEPGSSRAGPGRASGGPCPVCGGAGGTGLPIRANLSIPAGAIGWLAERHRPGGRDADRSDPGGLPARGSEPGIPASTGVPASEGVPASRDGPGGGCPDGPGCCPACGNRGGDRVPAPGDQGTERAGQDSTRMPVLGNLTFPLLTLLGLASRAGEAHGLGALDPALVRDLAAAGALHPASEFCVTVVDEHGYAIGHGCCKPARAKPAATAANARSPGKANTTMADIVGSHPGMTSTATFNPGRTGPAGSHPGMTSTAGFHPSMAGTAAFYPSERAGPDGGFGSWLLVLPGAPRPFTVDLGPVPTYDCDHRYASAAYAPSRVLRHLVQVRDGQCSFPACSRHARDSDFEHARPFDKGGSTCACNAHACSRSCHRVKQSTGWTVTKPRPGWTQWTTMTGRTYRQAPWQYPA